MVFPLGYAIYLSLFNYDIGAGIFQFVGLGNYGELLGDAGVLGLAVANGDDRCVGGRPWSS